MSSITYKLVFEGKIVAEKKTGIVKKKLVSLFKSSPEDIERLFSNSPVVIKKSLDHPTALKYQKVIENSGALCRIMRDTGAENIAAQKATGKTVILKTPEENRMTCPRCNYEQTAAEDCIQCGTVIRKYDAQMKPPPAYSPIPAAPRAKKQPASGFMRARWVVPVLVISFVLYGATSWWKNESINHGPGIIAPDHPEQEAINSGEQFSYNDYQITPLATFQLEARVLSAKRYRTGRESELSPVDLALGWGPMSDEAVLKEIKISQSNRFYYWKVKSFPIPRKEIEQNSANMHLIPSNREIAKVIKNVRTGHVVAIEGYLVRVNAQDNWWWKSSLSRNDTGNGACEVVWVAEIEIK
jgi:hypothetical protein